MLDSRVSLSAAPGMSALKQAMPFGFVLLWYECGCMVLYVELLGWAAVIGIAWCIWLQSCWCAGVRACSVHHDLLFHDRGRGFAKLKLMPPLGALQAVVGVLGLY